jgi:hypothetical protein
MVEAAMRNFSVGILSLGILAHVGPLAPPASAQDGGVASLRTIRRIYVDKMDNDLDQYIRAEIQKKFEGAIIVVLKPEAADAILAGVSEHQNGTRAAVTGRWFGLHDTATGSVSLLDKTGTTVLWSSEAGDRSIMWGSMKRGGPRKVADRLVSNLKKAMD